MGVNAPACAIILGSGLGGLADKIENARRLPYAEIPGFHATHVVGHKGQLIAGTLGGRDVVALAGRFHMYEGHSPRVSAFPVRVVHALGAKTLFVSNASGGIRRTFSAGDLMVIEDHLNLQFVNPLTGPVEATDERFPDMSAPYSPRLKVLLREAAKRLHIPLQAGVYVGLLGPTYETLAEVRMLERLGADATGMSTVPEVILANALGLEVVGVSLISNPAAGLSPEKLSHADVMRAAEAAGEKFCALVEEFVRRLD
ncbi:MAG: purine-nucleoside phosphorylase [Gemmatimonadaceae bacterium]|nr:purine-nucleoside phosphorylase [Gemmatimonadaceae bacterium]